MEVEETNSNNIVRKDGRNALQMRLFQAEQGLLNRADGSVRFSQNNSSVLIAVYGPTEVKQRKEQIDKATIEVVYKPPIGVAGYEERERENFIRSAIENSIITTLHPRTSIQIVIQVVSEDGSILSCAINGACMALLDAGISMKSMIASVTCAINKEKQLIIDPDGKEEKNSISLFTFVVNSPYDGIVASKTIGSFSEEQYFECLEAAKKGCSQVFKFVRSSEETKYKK